MKVVATTLVIKKEMSFCLPHSNVNVHHRQTSKKKSPTMVNSGLVT